MTAVQNDAVSNWYSCKGSMKVSLGHFANVDKNHTSDSNTNCRGRGVTLLTW